MIDVRTILMLGLVFVMLSVVTYINATVNNQTKQLAADNNDTMTIKTLNEISSSFNDAVKIVTAIVVISLFVAFAIWMYRQTNI